MFLWYQVKKWTENINTSYCSISRICQLYVYVWKFQEFWERICFFSVDENESLPSHLWQLPCSGQLSLWRNISHKSHTDLLQTVWKCFLQSQKCFFGLKEIMTRRRRGAVPLRRWRGEAFQLDSQLAARAEGGRPSIFRLAPCLHKKYWFRLKEISRKESLSTHYSEKTAVVL